MKEVNPLPPKIGYYLGSVVIFIVWFFDRVEIGWHIVLQLLRPQRSLGERTAKKVDTFYNQERWFYSKNAASTGGANFSAGSLSGDA